MDNKSEDLINFKVDDLKKIIRYEPDTGAVSFTSIMHRKFPKRPYAYISIGNKRYRSAHVLWYMYYGKPPRGRITYKNGNAADLRIDNMMDVMSRFENPGIKSKGPYSVRLDTEHALWAKKNTSSMARVIAIAKAISDRLSKKTIKRLLEADVNKIIEYLEAFK